MTVISNCTSGLLVQLISKTTKQSKNQFQDTGCMQFAKMMIKKLIIQLGMPCCTKMHRINTKQSEIGGLLVP